VAFNRVVGNVVGNVTGSAGTANTLTTAITIAISGNVTGTATSFDGSANISIDATAVNADGITSGTLAVARGGTGATTLNSEAVIIGNTTGAVKFVDPGTSGNVLTSNGTAWLSQAISAGGNYELIAFTSSGTWTKDSGLKAVKVTVIAAGGNSGAANPAICLRAGNAGGGGGGAIEYIPAPSIPGPVTVTVGTAPSKTSSFGPFVSATGGVNGLVDTPNTNAAGGAGSGGTINFNGQPAVGAAGSPQQGGMSALGFGPATGISPTPGRLYGGGASGSSPGQILGAAGIVIVEEFY
jgi:hypothetical protein